MFKAPRSNASTSGTNSLDEYVDITQVQQLLLENSLQSTSTSSSTTTSTLTTTTNSSSSSSKLSRPRINLQKAVEFSSQLQSKYTTRSFRYFFMCSAEIIAIKFEKIYKKFIHFIFTFKIIKNNL